MPSRTATAYPPTSGAGIARAAAGGYERLPEMANPITECDKAPEPRRAISAQLDALVIGWYLCRWRAELVDLRSAPGPFSGWWLRSRGGHASRGTAGGTPRPGRTRTPG